MTATYRCRLASCGMPTPPDEARRHDGCCSALHATQYAFLTTAQVDPPTEPVLRPPGPVARAAAARAPGRRRWAGYAGWALAAVLGLLCLALYTLGDPAPVVARETPAVPASTSTPPPEPTPSASRTSSTKPSRTPSAKPSATTDTDMAELRRRVREVAQDDG